ncbi:hypothetical protein [Caballeronia sp. 15711]
MPATILVISPLDDRWQDMVREAVDVGLRVGMHRARPNSLRRCHA